jgi:hypothetical protein
LPNLIYEVPFLPRKMIEPRLQEVSLIIYRNYWIELKSDGLCRSVVLSFIRFQALIALARRFLKNIRFCQGGIGEYLKIVVKTKWR